MKKRQLSFIAVLLLLLMLSNPFRSKSQEHLDHWYTEFQAGYTFYGFSLHSGHAVSLGITRRIINGGGGEGVLSTVPLDGHFFSFNAIGMVADGKFRPGARVGYEIMFILPAARAELTVTDGYVLLTPSAGINLFGAGSFMLGYSIGLNRSVHSGIYVSLHLNFGNLSD